MHPTTTTLLGCPVQDIALNRIKQFDHVFELPPTCKHEFLVPEILDCVLIDFKGMAIQK